MDLINNMLEYINHDNAHLIKTISKIVSKNKIETVDELKKYVKDNIDSKFKSDEDKLNHCLSLIEDSSYAMDSMDGDESYKYLELRNKLNEDKDSSTILNIIRIFELCSFEQVYIVEAYNYIILGVL